MILVNIHRLSQTIPLHSEEKSGKAAYFFMLTLHCQGVFKETHLQRGDKTTSTPKKTLNQFPQALLDVRSQKLTP